MVKRDASWLGRAMASLLLLSLPAMLVGQEEIDPRLQQVLADWKERRTYPPVQYDVEGKCLTTKEAIEAVNNSMKRKVSYNVKDFGSKWNVRLLIDVKGQRHRIEEEKEYINVSDGKVTCKARIGAFDGSMLTARDREVVEGKEVKPHADTPDVAVVTGNMSASGFTMQLAPLFASHGVVRFPPQYEIFPGKLDLDPDTSLITVHGTDVFEGRRCLLLRSYPRAGDGFEEFWIDTERSSALARWISYGSGLPNREMNIHYHKYEGYWLVSGWTFENRAWFPDKAQARTSGVERFNVIKTTIERNVDESRFRLSIEPGMLVVRVHNDPNKNPVKKAEAGKREYYRVEPSGRESGVYFEKGVELRQWDAIDIGLAASALVLLAAGVLVWLWRKHNGFPLAKKPSPK
jgi:hypothetical protein